MNETSPKSINTGIKLDETLHARLKALSALKDRTLHWLLRAAIEQHVEREEAYEREKQEDLERWRRYQATGKAIPQTEVEAWLDSIGSDHKLAWPK